MAFIDVPVIVNIFIVTSARNQFLRFLSRNTLLSIRFTVTAEVPLIALLYG